MTNKQEYKQEYKQQLWSKLLTFANQSCEQQTYVFFRQFSGISRWIHGCVKESTNTVVYDKVCRMSPPMLRIKQQRHQHKRDGFVLCSRLKSVNVRVAKHTGLPSFLFQTYLYRPTEEIFRHKNHMLTLGSPLCTALHYQRSCTLLKYQYYTSP